MWLATSWWRLTWYSCLQSLLMAMLIQKPRSWTGLQLLRPLPGWASTSSAQLKTSSSCSFCWEEVLTVSLPNLHLISYRILPVGPFGFLEPIKTAGLALFTWNEGTIDAVPFLLCCEQFTLPLPYFLSSSIVLFPRLGSDFKMYIVTSQPVTHFWWDWKKGVACVLTWNLVAWLRVSSPPHGRGNEIEPRIPESYFRDEGRQPENGFSYNALVFAFTPTVTTLDTGSSGLISTVE